MRFLPLLILLSLTACGGPTPTDPDFRALEKKPADQADGVTDSAPVTDAELLQSAREPGFEFYQRSPARLAFTPRGGGHAGWIRMSFNTIAQAALGPDGKLPVGATFPDGSVVVKEIYDDQRSPLALLAVMKKAPQSPNAGRGWVWGEYDSRDRPVVSAAGAGRACVGCHSVTAASSPVTGDLGHRDLVRTFGLRP